MLRGAAWGCAGLGDEPNDGIFALDGVDLIEGTGIGTGNGINNRPGLYQGLGVGTGDAPELAQLPGVGTGCWDRRRSGARRGLRELSGAARWAKRRHVRVGRCGSD